MKTTSPTGLTTQIFAVMAACCAMLLLEHAASAAPSVVGLWRFNEVSGSNILDSSGLGNNGVLQSENGDVPVRVAGQTGFGTALLFTNDGTDHAYVSIPGAASLLIGQTATNTWTITAWANESSGGTGDFVATYGRILAIDDGETLYFDSGAMDDAEMYTWSEMTAAWQIAWGVGNSVAPLLDQWEHWAMVYDGTNLTLYLNADQGPQGGMSSMPVTSPLAFPGYTGAVLIGSELDQPGTDTWNGMLDDVAIFDGALTQSQIATVMSGDFSAFIGGPPGIVSQPQSQAAPQGSSCSFTVGADGQAPFQYQWYFDATNQLSSAANPTATNSTLVLTNLQVNQQGAYTVVVSNSISNVTSQTATLSVFKATLVGLWRFNEPGGSNILDSSGLGNNGTLAGENGDVPGRAPSQPGFGSALSITNDGVDHAYVTIPSSGSLLIGETATNPWTITAWAYENSEGTGDFYATYGRILVIDDGTALQLESGEIGDAEFYTWARANTAWQIGWGAYPDLTPLLDQWEHWAVVYDGTNLSVYLDGNQGPKGGLASQPVTAALGGYLGFQDAILIGSELDQPGNRTWNGLLDDVAVFNIALSQSQIQTVMAGDFSAFVPKPPLTISSSSGNISLSWPAAQATFQLQSTTNLTAASWSNVPSPPAQIGSTLTVSLPDGAGTQYFRLVGP
ncbi:MAG TPA: LamG-like jellyroll fold domain-containing protein [Candidatus Baltobacteraceae bacterium]|jgi:hypothetical protein|nr:LamG-like jellyroll fold domain-containing protein [Candidatus Baltobacteraceae bacterium]